MIKPALILILSVSIISCNQTAKNDHGNTDSAAAATRTDSLKSPAENLKLDDERLTTVYASYIRLKDDLVKSNSSLVKTSAKKLADDLNGTAGYAKAAEKANEIAQETDLKKQRLCFSDLSDEMIKIVKKTPVQSGKTFVQYCPMAKDGNGAYWLSSEKEIRNPYYGDEMLNCGDVKEEITKK